MTKVKQQITAEDAAIFAGSFTLAEVLESFEIISAGTANVAAAKAAPEVVEPNADLIATAATLFKQGREAEDTKKGRHTRVLGVAEGLGEYTIVVYQDA